MKYKLTQDNDCHWYIIPTDKQEEWDEWLEIDSDDEKSWNVPTFASGIDSPEEIEFDEYDRR